MLDWILPLGLINNIGFANEFAYSQSLQYIHIFVAGKSKESEIKRINKELANIRNKFKGKKQADTCACSYPVSTDSF